MIGVMEWTKWVHVHFEETLKWAGIFGALSVSQFSYHFDTNVWQAFCKLWGLLTYTFYHGTGKVGILLYDLERIDGLPVLGAIYNEFLPPNKDLAYYNKYPAPVVELLYIHAELCKFQNVGHIYYDLWLDHFTENLWSTLHMGSKLILKKGKLECHSWGWTRCFLNLLVESLCFALWRGSYKTKNICMAALMASEQWISLALIVLGYIYHGLGEATSHPNHPSKANTIFPSYHVIHKPTELFSGPYRRCPDDGYSGDFPNLVCYVRLLGSKISSPQARHISGRGDIFLS